MKASYKMVLNGFLKQAGKSIWIDKKCFSTIRVAYVCVKPYSIFCNGKIFSKRKTEKVEEWTGSFWILKDSKVKKDNCNYLF